MDSSNNWGIDVTGRIMWYSPWPVDENHRYCQPTDEEIIETYGICGQAIEEVYLAFKKGGGDSTLLMEYLNRHMPSPWYLVDDTVLMDNKRWYTNEFYFYFIMFTKKIIADYNWHYTEGVDAQLSEYHKIYEIGHLQYVPFGKGEKDATNSVIISIMQFVQRKNIDIACIYQWLDTLARHKTNLNYSKDISALENFWVCSEFMFFFYEFVKIITNINNMLTISYESVSTYSLRFFSYTPEKIIINALKMIINKSGIMFRIDINQKGPTHIETIITRKRQFDFNKMHTYAKSINLMVNKIIPGVYLRTIKNFFNLASDPVLTFLTPQDGMSCSFSITWQKEKIASFLWAGIVFIILGITALVLPLTGLAWIKYSLASFCVPMIALFFILYKCKIEINTRQKLEKHLAQSNQDHLPRLEKLQIISEELIHEKEELENKVAARTKELWEANEKLKELDKIRANFFDNISHELKTPLTLISSPLESILKRQYGASLPYNHNVFNIIYKNCNRLIHLVNMLLQCSKLEQGKMQLNKSLVDIIEFTKNQFKLFEHQSRDKNIKTTYLNNLPGKQTLYIDTALFEMVIANLLSNAFKFSGQNSEITMELKASKNNEKICILVADTGVGIPPERHQHIFERFYQVESSHSRKHEGTGLGLSLANEIIKLHNGTISVQSAVGKGSVFTIELPCNLCDVPTSTEECRSPAFRAGASMTVPAGLQIHDSLPVYFNNPEQMRKQKKILLVEDNADMAVYIQSVLQAYYTVEIVENGIEALEKLEGAFTPDLIISDIMMPVMDGYTLLKETARLRLANHTPFIFLTARGSQEEQIRAFQSGAIDYITKPFNMDLLLFRIDTLLLHNEKRDQALMENMREKLIAVLSGFSGGQDAEHPTIDQLFCVKYNITKRENEIINYILKGLQDKEIAAELHIATTTVSKHLTNIYEKVSVSNRLELTTLILKQ